MKRTIVWMLASSLGLAGCGGSKNELPDVNEQITKLQSGVEDDTYEAYKNLQMLGPQGNAAVPQLRTLLKHKDEDLRAKAAKTLASMGKAGAAAAPDLTNLLDDKDEGVRYWAADALGKMGADALAALPKLQRLTRDPAREVAGAAQNAVKNLEKLKPKK